MTVDRTSCVQTARGPIQPEAEPFAEGEGSLPKKEEDKVIACVGKQAPDFEATAYVDGGFRNIKLTDYAGQWVVLCFYPGDFTFV